MPNLDIYTFAPSITLLMPLAGVGQSFRLYAPRYSSPVTPANALAAPGSWASRKGLSMRWRMDSEGALIMEWTS
jgi:hypothetical protein